MGFLTLRPISQDQKEQIITPFYIIGGTGSPVKFLRSNDNIVWNADQQNCLTDNSALEPITGILGIKFGNGVFVAIGNTQYDSIILISNDGLVFRQVYANTQYSAIQKIDFAHGRFIISCLDCAIFSTDCEYWTYCFLGATDPTSITNTPPLQWITQLTHDNTKHIIFAQYGGVFSSIDGLNWINESSDTLVAITDKLIHLPQQNKLFRVRIEPNLYMGINYLYWSTSPDSGITWENQDLLFDANSPDEIIGIELIDNTIFVTFLDLGVIKVAKSSDFGITLTIIDSLVVEKGTDIGTTKYVIGTNGNIVLFSHDGINWKIFGVEFIYTYPVNALLKRFTNGTGQPEEFGILSNVDWVTNHGLPNNVGALARNTNDDSWIGITDNGLDVTLSTAGVFWTVQNYNLPGGVGLDFGLYPNVLKFTAGKYFAIAYSSTYIDPSIMQSIDGITWTVSYNNTINYDVNSNFIDIQELIVSGNKILALPYSTGDKLDPINPSVSAFIYSSDGGASWVRIPMNWSLTSETFSSVLHGAYSEVDGIFYITTDLMGILKFDGTSIFGIIPYPIENINIDYTLTIPYPAIFNVMMKIAIHPTSGRIVAVVNALRVGEGWYDRSLVYSDDSGLTWSLIGHEYAWYDGINHYDGLSWLSNTTSQPNNFKFEGGIFCLAYDTGYVYSTTGTTWALSNSIIIPSSGASGIYIRTAPPSLFPEPPPFQPSPGG